VEFFIKVLQNKREEKKMHPELMRIVAEGIQRGQINTDPWTFSTFIVFGVITVSYAIYWSRFVKYGSSLIK